MAEPARWARLEPGARDRELAPGLEARTADPLWLLGRQWQFGEFAAADGGSAILANVSASLAPLTGLRPGRPAPAARAGRYAVPAVPLETLVEAEDVHSVPTARMRVRGGQHFERLLAAQLTASLAAHYVSAYRSAYPIDEPIDAGSGIPDSASRRFLQLVAGRAIDGEKLYRDLRATVRRVPATLPAVPVIASADVGAVLTAAQAWLAWADALTFAPSGGPTGWVSERLEYAFAVSCTDGITLEADEYADGSLEWHSFVATGTPATPPAGRTSLGPLTTIPSAVTYPGMPATRLWEFEDARVDFGAIEAGPQDLGRLLLASFALTYGANWLLIPFDVPVGTLARITRLDVLDTFGTTITVGPTAPAGEWGMFAISRDDGAPDSALFIAPALVAGLQGRDVEEVLLVRDEVANLAWAVERTVEGEDGRPSDRARAGYAGAPAAPPAVPPDPLTYRLRTDPPQHWFPLLPQREQPADPSMTFRLAALRGAEPGSPSRLHPIGRLLAPMVRDPRITVREEEVPREGARVTRAYQLARWMDGSTHLWLGRRKGVGRGEGSSGLRFDTTDAPDR